MNEIRFQLTIKHLIYYYIQNTLRCNYLNLTSKRFKNISTNTKFNPASMSPYYYI